MPQALLVPVPPPPGEPRLIVHEREPENAEFPMAHQSGWMTPDGLFYRRNHFPYPSVAVNGWRLEVSGLVARPLRPTLGDLQALPRTSRWVTLECAGNKRRLFQPQAEGTPWGDGAIGHAEWTGVPLASLLALAGVTLPTSGAGASEVLFRGADGFARSLPVAAALDPAVLLVWAMNGRPLPREHGAPVRLIVPRWYGMDSVKWLTAIELIDRPFRGRFQVREYVYLPGPGTGAEAVPVTQQKVNSTIIFPREGARLKPGAHWIRGIAWGGAQPLQGVAVSLDGGATWSPAELAGPEAPDAWRLWQFRTPSLSPGEYRLMARATDALGEAQPRAAAWNAKGYGNNQMPAVAIMVGLLGGRRKQPGT